MIAKIGAYMATIGFLGFFTYPLLIASFKPINKRKALILCLSMLIIGLLMVWPLE